MEVIDVFMNKIIFIIFLFSISINIWSMTDIGLSGTSEVLISDGSPLYPAFSPDGKSIACSIKKGADYDIYIVDIISGNQSPLITGKGNQLYPAFYPGDPSRLAYCSDEGGRLALYIYDEKTGKSVKIAGSADYDIRYPEVSPLQWKCRGGYDEEEDKVAPENPYYNILYLADYGSKKEMYWAHDWGGKSVIQETEGSPGYIRWTMGKDLYDYWSGANLGIIVVMVDTNEAVSHTLDLEGGASPIRIENRDVLFLSPSPNYAQFLITRPDGSLVLFDKFLNKEVKIDRVDTISPPAISSDGRTIAFVKNGSLYIQKVENSLSYIRNLWQLEDDITMPQIDKLISNKFVVTGTTYPNIVDSYYIYYGETHPEGPYFITSDSVLYLFYLYYDYLLRSVEYEKMIPLVKEMVQKGALVSQSELDSASGETREYIEFIRDYFIVARGLIDPSIRSGTYADRVRKEWENIDATNGSSDTFSDIDYTMFTVRGHYTMSPEFENYFKCVMWFSQGLFSLNNHEQDKGNAIMTLFLTRLINDENMAGLIDRFYDTIGLFVGEPESVNYRQVNEIMEKIYGKMPSYSALCDSSKLDKFFSEVSKLPPPKIVPQQGYAFALLPQVFTPDAYILQKLVYPYVGTDSEPRGLPKGLDLFASLGDKEAERLLKEFFGESRYAKYDNALEEVRSEFVKYGVEYWKTNISNGWVNMLTELLGEKGDRYPEFMRNIAWQDKSLMTALSSWTCLRHANVLYGKGTGTYGSGGGPMEVPIPEKPRGYVEPGDSFYDSLISLLKDTRSRLEKNGLWTDYTGGYSYIDETTGEYEYEEGAYFDVMLKVLERLSGISKKELTGVILSEDDYDYINSYGGKLWEITSIYQCAIGDKISEEFSGDDGGGGNISGYQQALIADVAFFVDVSGNMSVLHEAIGPAHQIICLHPTDLGMGMSHGGVFSYYEFTVEGKRLNDDDWKGMILGEGASEDWALINQLRDKYGNEYVEEYEKKLSETFEKTKMPEMPGWVASFYEPNVYTVVVDALRFWSDVYEDGGKVIGTLNKGDKVVWLGQEKIAGSEKQPDAKFRWLLVEAEDGSKGWVAQYGLVGKPVPVKEVYLR